MPLSAFPPDLHATYSPTDLLWGILEASLTGLALYAPLWNAAGTLVDFRIDLLNPAAQRILRQPARPSGTYLTYYPHTLASGVFAFHRQAFESGEPARMQVNYQADGLDNYFHLSAQRVGQGLLVSFTDTAEADRTQVELALRTSQREEQAARAQAEDQRNQLQALVEQAPVALGFFEGPELHIMAANQQLCAAWGRLAADVLHRPLLDALPELQGQGFDDLLRQVMATEIPVTGTETPVQLLCNGELTTKYYDFVYKPFYDAQGTVLGVLNVSVEVTAQVVARQQQQALNEELLAANRALEAGSTAVERARTEAELQRQLLHHVLEQAPAMICIFDGPQHTFQFVNPPYQALVGDRPLVGKPIVEAMPELVDQPIFGLLDQVYQTGETFSANEMLVQLDYQNEGGRELEKRYYNFIHQARYNLDGVVDGILVFSYDVTGQVHARQQVEQAHEQVQYLNEELATLNEELRANNDEYLTTNTALQEAQQQLQELNQALEIRVQERTRQLTAQQALLRQILGQVPAALATLSGPEHRYTFFNERYQALAANRTELGFSVAEVFPEVVTQGFVDPLDGVYATGQPFRGTDVSAFLYDPTLGQPRQYYVDFIYQPLFDEQQQVQGILAFIVDVTDKALARQQVEQSQLEVQNLNEELAIINEELLATNEELHQSNTHLTRTNHDLDTFVYTASHDLKAPITNIEGILEALRETLPPLVQQDAVVAHLLGLLDQTVGRFQRTIHQLTDLTRLQQTYKEPAELLLLSPIVADVLTDLTSAVAIAGAQVHVQVPPDLYVSFAPASLRSIIYNLLSNAVKYRSLERQAHVWLRAEQEANTVVLHVQDNGLGLTDSQQGRLFEAFQRLHTHVEGTGVGLFMIKRLIENAGATITVASTPAVGSTFTVRFPIYS